MWTTPLNFYHWLLKRYRGPPAGHPLNHLDVLQHLRDNVRLVFTRWIEKTNDFQESSLKQRMFLRNENKTQTEIFL